MKPVGLIFKFSEVHGLIGMEKIVREMILSSMLYILNHCRDLSTVDMSSVLAVSVTARQGSFGVNYWRRDIYVCSR